MSYATTVDATTATDSHPEFDNVSGMELQNTSLQAYHVVPPTHPVIPQWISGCYCALLCASVFFGIPGNAITAAAYANIKSMAAIVLYFVFHSTVIQLGFNSDSDIVKTTCDWYIMSVALIDLATCSFRNTSYFMEYLGVWARLTCSEYCKFTAWVGQSTVCMSIFLFALMAIDRYMKMCQSARPSIAPVTSRNLTLALTLVNVILATPALLLFDNNQSGICQVKTDARNKLVTAYYSAIFILFLLMMLTVIYCYVGIAIKVRRSKQVGVIELPQADVPGNIHVVIDENTSSITFGQHKGQPVSPVVLTNTTSFSNGGHASPVDEHPRLSDRKARCKGHGIVSILGPRPKLGAPTQSLQRANANGTLVQPVLSASAVAEKEAGSAALSRIQTKRKWNRQQRNIRVTCLLFVITSVFIISWIPPYAAMVKGFYIGNDLPLSAGDLVMAQYAPNIYVVNTFSNPLIYAILSPAYRKLVSTFMCRAKLSLSKLFHCV